MKFKKALLQVSILLPALVSQVALADFSGIYTPANWTLANSNSNGSVNTAGAPGSIAITSGNGVFGGLGTTTYSLISATYGRAQFNWSFSTPDGANWDPFGYVQNGTFVQLSNDGGPQAQSGTASISISSGQQMGFQARTLDHAAGASTTTVSNFNFSSAVYWKGNTNGSWTGSNWTLDAAGTNSTAVPDANVDVVFSATGAANKSTTLAQDFTVRSLAIQDAAPVTIAGANTLTLAGSAGTGLNVQIGAGLFTLSSNLTLGGASNTISVNNSAGAVISGVLGGANGLSKTGTGRLTLSTANTYTGTTSVSAGTLQMNHASALGAGPVNLAGTIALNHSGTTANAMTVSGTAPTLFIGTTANATTTATLTGNITGDGTAGTLAINSYGVQAGTNRLTLSGNTVALGNKSLSFLGRNGGSIDTESNAATQSLILANTTLATNGNVSIGRGTLNVQGTSNVTIAGQLLTNSDWAIVTLQDSASVTATGGVDLTAGGIIASSLYHNGGTLTTSSITGNYFTSGGGTHVLFNGGTVRASAANADFLRVRVNGNNDFHSGIGEIGNSGLTFDTNGFATGIQVALVNSQGATGTLTKSGLGTLTLSAANTYSGATTVNGGTLLLQNNTSSSAFAIAGGAVVEMNVTGYRGGIAPTTTFTGTGILRKTGAGLLEWTGSSAVFAFSAGALIDVQEGTLTGGSFANEVWTSNLSSLNVAAGATFSTVEANVRVDALTGAGTIKSGYPGAGYLNFTFGVANGSGDFTGTLQNNDGIAANIVKEGTGTQILSGVNTYTGTTTISQGTLQLGNGGTAGSLSASSVITNNGTLAFNLSNTITQGTGFANAIGGTGGLLQNGSGSVVLTSANSYTGATTISQGTLQIGEGGPAGSLSASSVITNNGTLAFNLSNTITQGTGFANAITGSGSLAQNGTGTVVLTSANTYTGTTTISQGTLQLGSGGATGSLAATSAITNNGTLAFNLSNTITQGTGFANNIGGTGSLVQKGTGTVVLGAGNTYTGTTTISSGTVSTNTLAVAAGSSGLGNATSPVVLGAASTTGTLTYTGSTNTFTRGLTIDAGGGQLTHTGSGALTLAVGGISAGGLFTVGGSPQSVFIGSAISGVGGLSKTGSNTLVLTGANTFSGGTTLSGGTLQVDSPTALGTGAFTIQGGSLNSSLGITNAGNNPLTINADFIFTGTSSLNLGSGIGSLGTAAGSTRTITVNAQTLTLGGAISAGPTAFAITKAGTGTLALTGSSSFFGATTVNGGTLLLGAGNSYLGSSQVNNAGTLLVRHSSSLSGPGNAVNVAVGGVFNYSASANAPLSLGSTLVLNGGTNTAIGGTIGSTATSASINVANVASATGAVRVNVFGQSFSGGSGTYTLLLGGPSSTLNGATYSLGNVYNNTNFTVSNPLATANTVTVDVASATSLTTAYWKGGLTGAANVWSASNGATQSNWVASNGGANQALVPGATTDIIFSNSPVTTPANAAFLGADMTIRSLTQQDTVNSFGLNADGHTLTIAPTLATTGITIAAGGQGMGIHPNVILGSSQTWTINSGGLTAYGTITNGSNLLTIAGGSSTTLNGGIGNGTGGVFKSGGGILFLQAANTYTGSTQIQGGTLQIQGVNGTLTGTSAIGLSNNASLTLANTLSDVALNRLGDAIGLTVGGGSLNYNNTLGAGAAYAETVGAVSLTKGQFNVNLANNMTGVANSQTLTLASLSQSGTANVTFSAATTGPNASTNVIRVNGAGPTTAGQIIGPWATTGTTSGNQTDYAVFDASGRVLPANIAASTADTWVAGSNATVSGNTTLDGAKSLNSLRYTGSGATLNLVGSNLDTFGFLNGSSGQINLNSNGGALRQSGTAAANLHLNAGNSTIVINAPVRDNTGALTLVKSGAGLLALNAANSFSGGTVLNAGTLHLDHALALGSGTLTIQGGSIQSSLTFVNANNNPTVINADFTGGSTNGVNLGTGAVSLGDAPGTTRTITASTGFLTLGGIISDGATANSLTKNGGAVLILSNSNTYTGTTTVSGGTLRLTGANSYTGPSQVTSGGNLTVRNSASLSGAGNSVAVATGGAFTYYAATSSPLSLGSTLALTGGTNSAIGGSIGSTSTSSAINVAGAATATGAVKVNVYGQTFNGGTGTYTLVQGGVGSSLGTATYSLGTVYNNTNFTVGAPSATSDTLTVPVTAATALATAYWKGGLTGSTNVWAASNGTTQSNWVASSGGADQPLVPGGVTDVVFSNSPVTTSPNGTSLGADMTLRSLTQQDTLNPVVLNTDGHTLTLAPLGSATGITVNSGAQALTLGSALNLASDQTWTINSSSLNLNGVVNHTAGLLTVTGTASTTFNAPLQGSGSLTKLGTSTLVFNNANTYTGVTTVLGGTLQIAGVQGAILNSSSLVLGNNASLTLANSTGDTASNRLGNGIGLVSHGGTFNFNNSLGSGAVYAETIGAVSLVSGHLNLGLNTDMTGGAGNAQTLTLSALTSSGNATATFFAGSTAGGNTGPNTYRNTIQVAGETATPAGRIIGPWATTSTAAGATSDFAVYDASGRILPAAIPATPSSLWSSASDSYTFSTGETLFATRNIAALRITNGATLNLALGSNLGTTGILSGSINPGTGGVVTLPTATAGNLYLNSGGGSISISAPIRDNTASGVLTVVKSGNNFLNLSGANTFTGGLTLNGGGLNINSASALGSGTFALTTGTAFDQASGLNTLSLATNNPVALNGDVTFNGTNSLNLGTGAVSLGTTPGATTRVITANVAGKVLTLGGSISNGATAFNLTHNGSGVLHLTGANTYIGATSVTGTGTLILSGANAYAGGTILSGTSTLVARQGSALGVGSVTVGTNTALNYQASADAPLAITGSLGISYGVSGGTSTALGGSIGSTTTSSAITVSGAALATGAVKVNVYGQSFSGGTGTYTLLQGGASSNLSAATFSLGTVYNNTNFTVTNPAATAATLTVDVAAATALTNAYWKGGLAGATQVWAASNGANASNWGSDLAGTASAVVPGAGTNVVFSATTVTTAPAASTLGADMAIASLTQQDTVNAAVLNYDGYGLTLGSGGVTISATASTKALTLNPNLTLGAAQTWTNNQAGLFLTVNGDVSTGANLLTVTGAGPTTINGAVSGSAGLAKAGTNSLTLNSVNTYTGDTTIASTGNLSIGGIGSLGAGNYAGNITFSAVSTFTHASAADQTLSGLISGPGNLTKSGIGNLSITGNLAHTGLTTVSAGRMILSGNNSAATGGMTLSGGITLFDTPASLNGTARNVSVTNTGAILFAPGFDLASTLLTRVAVGSTGAIAADNYASSNFDFNAAGLTGAYLGAVGAVTYTGTLTPAGNAWRLGGGGGTLTLAAPLTGSSNALNVGGHVILPAGNTYAGLTTINTAGTLQLDSGLSSIGSTAIVNNGNLLVTNAAAETFGSLTGTGTLTKNGTGSLTITTPQHIGRTILNAGSLTFASPSYAGQLTVNGGTFTAASGDFSLRVNQAVELNGGTVNLGSGRQYLGSLSGQVGNLPASGGTLAGSGPLTLNQTTTSTFAGNLAATGSTLVKTGGGILTLTNPATTTSALSVINGALTLQDNATLSQISGLTLGYGTTLTLDNTGTQHVASRLPDTLPLTLRGGSLTYRAPGSTLATENLGALHLASGASVVSVTSTNTGVSSADLVFAGDTVGLTRSPAATVNFFGFGGTLGTAGAGATHVAFTVGGNAATTSNVIAGGLVNNIIPWATVGGTEFASYLPYTTSASGNSGGIGALNATGYAGYNVNQGTALGNLSGTFTQNVRATASSVVPAGGLNINSLALSGTTPITFANASDTLNLTSGGLLHNVFVPVSIGGSVDSGLITAGGVAPGSPQSLYLFNDSNTLTLNSRVVDNPDGSPVSLVLSTSTAGGIFSLANPNNTYSGGTVVNRASVTLSGAASAVGATIAVIPYSSAGLTLNNSTLTVSTNAQQIASGNVVTLNGGSTLNLNGATTLAGLVFNSNGGANTPTVGTGTTLTLTGGITSVPTNVAVTPLVNVSNLNLNAQAAAPINVTALPEGNLANNGATPVALNGLSLTSIIANGGLTKTGTGVLALTNSGSTYAGQLTVEEGVLNISTINGISTNGPLGNSALPVILGKTGGQTGTLEYSGSNTASSKPFSLAGGGVGAFQIDSPTTTLTLSGLITDSGAGGSLAKTGAGILALTNVANTYTGATSLNAGVLNATRLAAVNTPSSIGQGSAAGSAADLVFGGGTLQYNTALAATTDRLFTIGNAAGLAATLDSSAALATNRLSFTGTGAIGTGGSGARSLTLTGTNTGANSFASALVDGIGGATSLIKAGTGTWTITGASTFTGTTTVSGGILRSANGGALASTSAVTVTNTGSTLSVNYGGTSDYTQPELVSLLGKTTFADSSTSLGLDTSNAVGEVVYGGIISMPAGLVKLGSGTLTLEQTNTYTGTTTVASGTLRLNNAGAPAVGGNVVIGDGTATIGQDILLLSGSGGNQLPDTALLTFNGTTTNAGILRLGGLNETVGGLASTSGAGIVENGAPGTSILTLDVNGTDRSFAGILQNGASGTLGLTKTGTAKQTLTSATTYTGATNVNGGTLQLSAAHASASLSVASSATLSLSAATLTGGVSLANGATLSLAGGSGGLDGEYYNVGATPNQANFASIAALNAHLSSLTPALLANSSLVGSDFNFQTTGSGFPAPYNVNALNLEVRWTGLYKADTAGLYTFYTASDDGSMLFIDGVAVVTNNFPQAVTERSGTISLSAGFHDIVIAFNQGNGGYGMTASVTTPGGSKMFIPQSSLFSSKSSAIGSLTGDAGSALDLTNGLLAVGSNNTSTEFAGAISGTTLNGFGGLTKNGTGTLTLSGANTYNGTTTVNAGTLALGSGGLPNSTVAIGSAATLSGLGTIGGTTISGTHAPGSGLAGLQEFTNGLGYGVASHLQWNLNASTATGRGVSFTGVNVTGGSFFITPGATLDLSFGGTANFADTFWRTSRSWMIADLSSGVIGDGGTDLFTIGSITGGVINPNGSFSLVRQADGGGKNDVVLNWTSAVPATAFDTWMDTYAASIAPADRDPDDDPDQDRLTNIVEYAFGLDPSQGTSKLPAPMVVGGNLVLGFTQPVGVSGVVYGAESSTTLAPGSWQPVTDLGSGTTHIYSVPIGTFLRLTVTSP